MIELLQALLNRCNTIPGINFVALFNNQLQNKKEDNVFFPAIYLEVYNNVEYEAGLGDVQYGTATLRFHLVNNSPLQGSEMDIYILKGKVNEYLQHYTNGKFQPMVRTAEELDTNHDNLYIYKIDYQTRFSEVSYLDTDYNTVTVNEIDVKYDMDNNANEIKIDIIK